MHVKLTRCLSDVIKQQMRSRWSDL